MQVRGLVTGKRRELVGWMSQRRAGYWQRQHGQTEKGIFLDLAPVRDDQHLVQRREKRWFV